MTIIRLFPLLLLALTVGAQAKDTLNLRIKADGSEIEFYHRGRKLSEPRLEQLCATARREKTEIVFDREKMTRDNALAAILKEAQCLGATHSGATKTDPKPAPKSGSHTRAKPRHTAKARR